MNGLANREICIAMSWSSDYALSRARARAVGVDVNLAFTVPKEGANQNFSSMLIPEGAPHPQAAYQFINFMLRPEVIAEITNEILLRQRQCRLAPIDKPEYHQRSDAVSDARDRVAIVQVRGSVRRN